MTFSKPIDHSNFVRTLVLEPVCRPDPKSRGVRFAQYADLTTEMASIEAMISEYKQAIQASAAQMETKTRSISRRIKSYTKKEQATGDQLQQLVNMNILLAAVEKRKPKPPPESMYL